MVAGHRGLVCCHSVALWARCLGLLVLTGASAMSGEGQVESLGGAGGADAAGLRWRHVPSQGGASGPSRAIDPGAGGPGSGGPGSGGQDERSVPAQREGGSLGSVLPAPHELPVSDAALIRRMREGDDSAYEELFRRHSESVRRYARTCCRDAHTAEDLTAEVFARTLQAVRGGSGPEQSVRAYLLTTVRRVAAAWTKTARREQLVEDFAVFAAESARSSAPVSDDALDLGADVQAMHEAEQSLALQAFRSLPERWQAVLWHTTVEEESPSKVAPLFGLTANATAVLASRAREGLKQAYLQAHVSSSLTSGGDCARYADRLGAHARGGLRMRAERGLRKHLEECVKCRLAAGELAHVNAGIPALLPVAVIGWFAAGYSLKAAGMVVGGAAGAAGAGAAAAAAGGTSSSTGGAACGAVAEGLGAPAKAGIAAAAAVSAAAGLLWAFSGGPAPAPKPEAKHAALVPVAPRKPAPSPRPEPAVPPLAEPGAPPEKPSPQVTPAVLQPKPIPTPVPSARPAPEPPTRSASSASPAPTPTKPAPAPKVYQLNRLKYEVFGDHTGPEVRLGRGSWIWQRWDVSISGKRYGHGVTVHATSSVTIDLNRRCTSFDALVGVDDLSRGRRLGAMRFSVYGDGAWLWRSPVVHGRDAAVPVHVPLAGLKTIRLVVSPHTARDSAALGDWAQSQISCN